MFVGRLRHRIGIYETPETVDDGIGGDITQNEQISNYNDRVIVDGGTMEAQACVDELLYTPVAEVWANVEVETGSRTFDESKIENNQRFTITMRSIAYELTTRNIIKWGSYTMTIHSIAQDYLNEFITIEAWA